MRWWDTSSGRAAAWIRLSDRPFLTIVLAASHSAEAVARSLATLGPARPDVEIIVAASAGFISSRSLHNHVAAPVGASVPRLRRLGLDQARGNVVVFTEDSCTIPVGWLSAWRVAFADPLLEAATGPVIPAMGDRGLDWAVFFCEYAPFLMGRAPRFTGRLAGNNFAVRRSMGQRLDPTEIHEGDVPAAVTQAPGFLRLVPEAAVGHKRRYGIAEAVRDRLRFGRDYGRRRASALPIVLRGAGLVIGPLVLSVQVVRLIATVVRNGRNLGEFVATAPITIALLTAWSVGEWQGWMAAALSPGQRQAVSPPRCETVARRARRTSGQEASRAPHCKASRDDA